MAYDEETGEQGYKEVVRLFRNETKEWYHIHVDGEEIVCTGGHPFYVDRRGFVKTKDLKAGDKLTLSDGKQVTIEKIEIEEFEKPETTYNFEVEDFHTYYVTESNILVHNDCGGNVEFELANRGQSSTGRRIPHNLKEQLAMEQAMSRPLDGTKLPITINDSRWATTEGWIKMQQTFSFYDGSSTTIHYVLNKSLRLMDDFKFVFPL